MAAAVDLPSPSLRKFQRTDQPREHPFPSPGTQQDAAGSPRRCEGEHKAKRSERRGAAEPQPQPLLQSHQGPAPLRHGEIPKEPLPRSQGQTSLCAFRSGSSCGRSSTPGAQAPQRMEDAASVPEMYPGSPPVPRGETCSQEAPIHRRAQLPKSGAPISAADSAPVAHSACFSGSPSVHAQLKVDEGRVEAAESAMWRSPPAAQSRLSAMQRSSSMRLAPLAAEGRPELPISVSCDATGRHLYRRHVIFTSSASTNAALCDATGSQCHERHAIAASRASTSAALCDDVTASPCLRTDVTGSGSVSPGGPLSMSALASRGGAESRTPARHDAGLSDKSPLFHNAPAPEALPSLRSCGASLPATCGGRHQDASAAWAQARSPTSRRSTATASISRSGSMPRGSVMGLGLGSEGAHGAQRAVLPRSSSGKDQHTPTLHLLPSLTERHSLRQFRTRSLRKEDAHPLSEWQLHGHHQTSGLKRSPLGPTTPRTPSDDAHVSSHVSPRQDDDSPQGVFDFPHCNPTEHTSPPNCVVPPPAVYSAGGGFTLAEDQSITSAPHHRPRHRRAKSVCASLLPLEGVMTAFDADEVTCSGEAAPEQAPAVPRSNTLSSGCPERMPLVQPGRRRLMHLEAAESAPSSTAQSPAHDKAMPLRRERLLGSRQGTVLWERKGSGPPSMDIDWDSVLKPPEHLSGTAHQQLQTQASHQSGPPNRLQLANDMSVQFADVRVLVQAKGLVKQTSLQRGKAKEAFSDTRQRVLGSKNGTSKERHFARVDWSTVMAVPHSN